MIPNSGKLVHRAPNLDCLTYASEIGDALRLDMAARNYPIKTIMKWSGASDRCIKNWLSGNCGPSGRHLLMLARHSDPVFGCVLRMSGREGVLPVSQLRTLHEALADALENVILAEQSAMREPGALSV